VEISSYKALPCKQHPWLRVLQVHYALEQKECLSNPCDSVIVSDHVMWLHSADYDLWFLSFPLLLVIDRLPFLLQTIQEMDEIVEVHNVSCKLRSERADRTKKSIFRFSSIELCNLMQCLYPL